jgi:hypothetical protein
MLKMGGYVNCHRASWIETNPMSKIISLQEWQDQQLSNPQKDDRLFLSEAEVRSFQQFANITEDEVENIIQTLHTFSLIIYEVFCKENHDMSLKNAA